MLALQTLTVLPARLGPEMLCRSAGHTCGRCCWGDAVPRATLERRIRRQTHWFLRLIAADRAPSALRLLLFELWVRRGADLILALLLLTPILGDWLRPRLRRRMSCAFLGFDDSAEQRIGCLLHPSRWQGHDRRQRSAFALLPGLGCGQPDFFCLPAWRFAHASRLRQRAFLDAVNKSDWFSASARAANFGQASVEV